MEKKIRNFSLIKINLEKHHLIEIWLFSMSNSCFSLFLLNNAFKANFYYVEKFLRIILKIERNLIKPYNQFKSFFFQILYQNFKILFIEKE